MLTNYLLATVVAMGFNWLLYKAAPAYIPKRMKEAVFVIIAITWVIVLFTI